MIDIQTFGKKVVALQSVLLKQASAMKPGNVDAQDLVQETLLKLWGMRERLETHPNLEALAIKTLKGIAIDHYRHRQLECEQRLQQPEQATEFTYECELNDELRMVRCVVQQLPPLQQQIFMLKEIEGYEAHEIQTLCGCSPEALRQNLSRARRFVRKELLRISDEMGKNRSIERKGNKMNEQKINQLIEKYLNGDTSCREEDELRTYFATVKGDIPEAWQPLRQLFVWELHQRQRHKESYPNRRRLHWSWLATAISVAAVFIFLFMLTLQFQSSSANYVIINGEKTTNQETVIQEAENALGNVSSTQQEDFNALFQIGETNHEN